MIISFPLEITTPKKRYGPAGQCIYGNSHRGKLTEEHIMPFGIAGDSLILPAASCRDCARITGKVERYCLRGMLGNFRIAAGVPTRRPKERPKKISVRTGQLNKNATSVDGIQTIIVSPTDIVMLPLFTFPGAGILENRGPTADVHYQANIFRLEGQMEEFSRKYGAIETTTFFPMAFIRMLAKIAHSYAVAELGPDSFRPYLLDLILCRIHDLNVGLQWIGCEPTTPPPTGDLFSISYNKCIYRPTGARLIIVHARLFPFFNTPLYHIVVGEWDG